jgi:hypothetical protein
MIDRNKKVNKELIKQRSDNSAATYSEILNVAYSYYIDSKRHTIKEVAIKYSIPHNRLRSYISKKGVPWAGSIISSNKKSDKFIDSYPQLTSNEFISKCISDDLTCKDISDLVGCSINTVSVYFRKSGNSVQPKLISAYENKIQKFLEINNIYFEKNNRTLLSGKEIDFFIPNSNLGIEVNGVYWHSESQGKDKKYHVNKTNIAKENNISIMHIFDFELDESENKIYSILKSKFEICDKIYGRKCNIILVNPKEAKDFFIKNHIQNSSNSSITYGLTFNGELVCAMSFGKSRFNKKYE